MKGTQMTASAWKIESITPTLAVHDLDVGIEYYERLGFKLQWKYPDNRATHAGIAQGTCFLMLCECEPAERADLMFCVDDVHACYHHVERSCCWEIAIRLKDNKVGDEQWPPKRSLTPPIPPKPTDYGMIDFTLVDPWGHQLTFGMPTATPAHTK